MTLDEVLIETRSEWRAWLSEHHRTSSGIWLVRWKKASGHPHLSYDDTVEEALCVGWIDSQPRPMNDLQSQLRVTPRKPTSRWSALNKARAERLIQNGLMRPAGLAVIEQAKLTGTWTALDSVEALIEPDDLSLALDADTQARLSWDGFPRSARRAILEWLAAARTDATRQRRIARIVSDARAGVRSNQWRQPARRST